MFGDFPRFVPALAIVLVLLGIARASEPKQDATITGQPVLSDRVVSYQIKARYDEQKKTIDAMETLKYRNETGQPLQEFPFHLYLNAFQPTSTWMREGRLDSPGTWDPKHFGSIEIRKLEVDGMGDLTSSLRFVHPDDDNAEDRTVVQLWLPQPIPSGAQVTFRIVFHDQLPEVFSRTGYKGKFVMGAQWFPKIGVWWRGSWNCHQFHAHSEFFSDFGTYEINLTLPRNYIVGSSGDEIASTDNPDGTRTTVFLGADIHDFAWTADPNFKVVEDKFVGSTGPVKIRLLMQPGTFSQWHRYISALKGAMRLFDEWYGPYPYDRITVVDPPPNTAAGGMEYPTLITAGTVYGRFQGVHSTESVVVHEFGHQYWYGMVATNEAEEPWLDEGINSYTEVKVMDRLYGKDTSLISLSGLTAGAATFQHVQYSLHPDSDPVVRPAYHFMDGRAYGAIAYSKSAAVLLTLEGMVGEDTMRTVLATWFKQRRFTHPSTEDFLKTVEATSGKDFHWFFDQAIFGTQILDYEVSSLDSDEMHWYQKQAHHGDELYRDSVLVHRKGDFIFPVEVEVRFSDGERIREMWDGRDRWKRFNYEKKARVVAATIDPDQKVWLDIDWYNNSRTTEPHGTAANKLVTYYLLFEQFLSQAIGWLI